jgi:hypothetical protein
MSILKLVMKHFINVFAAMMINVCLLKETLNLIILDIQKAILYAKVNILFIVNI